jgi:hypothetical protein
MPADVAEIGALSRPPVVTARDGGAAALIQGRVLWLFGDTLMTVVGEGDRAATTTQPGSTSS